MTCTDVAKITGQHILFLGTDTVGWALSQFQDASQFAKAHGVDSLLVKSADGGNWWYGGLNGYRQIKAVINTAGINCIPYMYSYGNKFNALDAEIAIMQALMADSDVVCADMETEWDSQISWASYLCSKIQSTPGLFLISTWADPTQQNWTAVLAALNPCVSAYMPQQYDDYLASCWQQFGNVCLQPTLELTQDVGPNNPVANAQAAKSRGSSAISIWYYEEAEANSTLLDQVLAAFPKTGGTMAIPTRWSDDGTTLTGPNNLPVVLGFRDYVLANNWDPSNWPLEPEQHLDVLEQSNPALGGGQSQIFRWTRLEYTVAGGIIEGWMGAELMWYQTQYSALQATIAQLTTQVSTLQGDVSSVQALLASSNIGQISTLGKQIQDDIALIMQLTTVQ